MGFGSNEVLLAHMDDVHDLNLVVWDGSSFGSTTERETSLYADTDVERAYVAKRTGAAAASVSISSWAEVKN